MRIPNSALTQRMRINVPKDYILYETHGENPHRIRGFTCVPGLVRMWIKNGVDIRFALSFVQVHIPRLVELTPPSAVRVKFY